MWRRQDAPRGQTVAPLPEAGRASAVQRLRPLRHGATALQTGTDDGGQLLRSQGWNIRILLHTRFTIFHQVLV